MKNGMLYNRNKQKVADDLLSNVSGGSRSSAKLAANIGALNRTHERLTKKEKMAERRARAKQATPLDIVKEESGEQIPGRSRSNTMADLLQPPTPEV